MHTNTMTRRGFLGGTAGVALGATAASTGLLSGVALADEEATDEAAAQAAESGLIPSAQLNPQDYDYRSNSITDFTQTTLFSPWKLGPIELNHRMVKSAAGSATFLNGFTDELIQYYINFAKGGVEMIWVEYFANHMTNYSGEGPDWLFDLDLSPLVEGCKQYGAHLGFQTYLMGADHNGMSTEELQTIQSDIVKTAQFLQEQGFEALEINAAGANIGAKLFSRANNQRTDQYGPESAESRARFVTEVIQAVKEACGEDFVVQVLMNGIEENDSSTGNSAQVMSLEEGLEIAKLLEAAGADSLHVRLGPIAQHVCQFAGDLYFVGEGIEGSTSYGTQFDFSQHWQGKLVANHSGAGLMLDVAAEYKKAVSIPVGTVTYMDPAHAPDYFEQALVDGKCDFFLMTRPLTVDTEYVNKLREGRIDEIAPCTRCVHCHIMGNAANRESGYCRVNALTQRVMTENGPATYELPPLEGDPKKVMVVGGGPAGMEAARIAALRGHEVTLYEKNGMLGGTLTFANTVKGPHENLADLIAYLERQMEVTGVTVVTGTEVTADLVASEAPDALVLACGGVRDTLGLEATGGTQVVPFDQFMFAEMGEKVTVYGSSCQAVDAALWLQNRGKKVTMVTPSSNDDVDKGQSNHEKEFILPMLYVRGMRVWPSATITAIGDGTITFTNEAGIETTIACDAVIEAMDMLPNKALLDGVSVAETYAVGDCDVPFNIADAIKTGNLVGRKL